MGVELKSFANLVLKLKSSTLAGGSYDVISILGLFFENRYLSFLLQYLPQSNIDLYINDIECIAKTVTLWLPLRC